MEKQEILLESGTNEVELLTFSVGKQVFGINVAKVQAIIKFEPSTLTSLPDAPPSVMGMMLYREKTIPIVDLSITLNVERKKDNDQAIAIVTEFNNSVNSFLADGVNRIHRVSWNKFVPINALISNSNTKVTGSIHIGDDDVMVIDLEGVLAQIFPYLAIQNITEQTMNHAEREMREKAKIVFAEDSKVIRDTVRQVLRDAGYTQVQALGDGKKAFELLESLKLQSESQEGDDSQLPDIVISDIEMPEMDGLTLCRKIKEDSILKDIKVVMFSSLINNQMIKKCESVGADNYITKPETNKLVGMLDEMVC